MPAFRQAENNNAALSLQSHDFTFDSVVTVHKNTALSQQVTTLVEGNEVGGSFYLSDTAAIAADATAQQMETLLEATDLGDVNVTR